jgi:hypothetical protein
MSIWQSYLGSSSRILLATLLLVCSCVPVIAGDVPLTWDPSVTENIAGYRVYVGTASRTYSSSNSIGNKTSYTVTGLSNGTYYFAVTAIDTDGLESDFSNEISRTLGASTVSCNINGDGSVNVLDLQELTNVILGKSSSSASFDLNWDGRIDVLDLQILNNVVLGVRSCP